jgi:hypothetical protein
MRAWIAVNEIASIAADKGRDGALDRARWDRTLPNNQVWIGVHRAQSPSWFVARIYRSGACPTSARNKLRGHCATPAICYPQAIFGPKRTSSSASEIRCPGSHREITPLDLRLARHRAKTSNEAFNQLLGVHQRGHLRRRAFCAELVFAFSLWLV